MCDCECLCLLDELKYCDVNLDEVKWWSRHTRATTHIISHRYNSNTFLAHRNCNVVALAILRFWSAMEIFGSVGPWDDLPSVLGAASGRSCGSGAAIAAIRMPLLAGPGQLRGSTGKRLCFARHGWCWMSLKSPI